MLSLRSRGPRRFHTVAQTSRQARTVRDYNLRELPSAMGKCVATTSRAKSGNDGSRDRVRLGLVGIRRRALPARRLKKRDHPPPAPVPRDLDRIQASLPNLHPRETTRQPRRDRMPGLRQDRSRRRSPSSVWDRCLPAPRRRRDELPLRDLVVQVSRAGANPHEIAVGGEDRQRLFLVDDHGRSLKPNRVV